MMKKVKIKTSNLRRIHLLRMVKQNKLQKESQLNVVGHLKRALSALI